ncbi:heavy metal translocating P-type ATPase [Peptoniphilus stercorisuis]|uniref:P-type Cu(+) transporter n=1 Tax=Peptoniphilus stercorisuis TaxID=1436965 RepID=A0ABS4K9Z5_9FIRM|nr:heavy metal translocating P-type ATPase [Peptoniphilus stercorisuis]MBP2024590.1 Cu2+-exporting ATPase [Peptoniphilus stercorisuis]
MNTKNNHNFKDKKEDDLNLKKDNLKSKDEHMNMNEHEHMNMNEHEHMNMNEQEHMAMGGHSHHAQMFKKKFIYSLFLGIPILILSPMMGINLPFTIIFKGSDWVVLILSTILFFYGGKPFLSGARDELKKKSPGMMMLISLGITVSYIYSVYAFIGNNILHLENMLMDFFWELASLILIMLLGHYIEMKAVGDAGDALKKMAELLPSDANLLKSDESIEVISLKDVKKDDNILVRAGEIVPTDGEVIKGSTSINESMITGESKLVEKNIKDKVIGGSINGNGTITVKVSATGESGYLAQVMNLVSEAQKDKSKMENLSDKVAKYLFYIALSVGIIAFIVWFIVSNNINIAIEIMVTVLVIACPHALGLAIPLVSARSTSIGAKNGLLIKNRNGLEESRNLDYIVMDKTGTLTEGNFKLNYFDSLNSEYSKEEILSIIAGIEEGSSHPLAVGILDKAKELNIKSANILDIKNISGVGLKGIYNNKEVMIVNRAYLVKNNIDFNEDMFNKYASSGNTISFLLIENKVSGIVSQGDEIKENASEIISKIKSQGIKVAMLTGDNKMVAENVGKILGINEVYAELMPEDKEMVIKKYIENDKKVMMVGDGVNDAPSLARATVGVAIGAGTDVAIDSADIILVKSDPMDILNLLKLSRNTWKKTIQNLWWGAGYNLIAIPLAAGILAPIGIMLNPAIGAIFMSLSTVIVAINAMRLKLD